MGAEVITQGQEPYRAAAAPSISLSLARRILRRDWKSGELNILIVSILLAIATVTSISLFTSRIHNSIYEEAAEFIAADAKISGSMPMPAKWTELAHSLNLKSADIVRFRSMSFSQDDQVLTQVKAVSDAYPLKGELLISQQPYERSHSVTHGPKPGEAWLAARLFAALNIQRGDSISIGDASFIVSHSLNKEPDAGQSLFGVAPRVMINIADLGATNAVQVGSRIDYDFLLSGKDSAIQEFENRVKESLGNHHRWVNVNTENRGVGDALARAESFLLLTGCLAVVLSGVAIALAARRYAKRQQAQVAILKTLGVNPKNVLRLYGFSLFAIGAICIIVGAALGWLLHWGIIFALGDLMPADLASASLPAYGTGALTGFVALWAFAAPPLIALRHVSPTSILREEKDPVISAGWSSVIGAAAIIFLMLFYSRDIQLTLIVAAGSAVCLGGVTILSSALIIFSKFIGNRLNYTWRLGLASLKRHQRFNALQMMIFSVLLMLLFTLLNVRSGLLSTWQDQLPDDAPNHFAFNIFPEDTPSIKQFFSDNNVAIKPFYPMTRGRVISVNATAVKSLIENQQSNMNYRRELNLTWSQTMGADNKIVAGKWWGAETDDGALLVSVEQEYAEGLGITPGDEVEFSVAGIAIKARVASIRSVKWDSMNPNFFMIFNRELADGIGANWITSFYLPKDAKPLLNKVSRQYPTISLVEIDQTIAQIESIIAKVSMAIEFILLLVLASGILVLVTSIQATLDLRIQESAIFRTIGANKALIRKIILIEFATLGLFSGLLAAAGTELCFYFLQTAVFDLEYQTQGLLWLWGPIVSALLISCVGWLSARNVVTTPPLAVLRQA